MRLPCCALCIALSTGALAATASAVAQSASVSSSARARAAARFKQGEQAFKRLDYAAAADAFLDAYQLAPHPSALFNAARSLEKAGDSARAANLCARYLADAPADDKRRGDARALLSGLLPKLGRISARGGPEGRRPAGTRGSVDLRLDGVAVEIDPTFVDPGDHVVSAEFDGERVERKVTVGAGSLVQVVLEPKQAPDAAPRDEPSAPAPARAVDDAKSRKPLAPGWVYAGAGLTVALGGVTLWSGLDTKSARSAYDENPTPDGLDQGRDKQARTNLLLGLTAVTGLATAVVGLWLTDFSGKRPPPDAQAALLIGPAQLGLHGRF